LFHFDLKHLESSKNLCKINSLLPLLFCPFVRNNILLVIIIIGTHRTRPPHHTAAAAAPARVGATSGSNAAGPNVGWGGGGYGAAAAACMCAA
jgi:hypothetical protein